MLPQINRKLLPMKGHYFFFNGATAPVIPFLPIIARQLGFSAKIVGLIYTVLPILAMLAKPILGGIADKFKIKKFLFILFQIIMTVSLLSINFIPEIPNEKVHFICDFGETVFDINSGINDTRDACATSKINEHLQNRDTIQCKLSCNVPDRSMHDTICAYWLNDLDFCKDNTKTHVDLTAVVPKDKIETFTNVTVFKVGNLSLPDGSFAKPFCPPGHKISLMCDMACDSAVVNEIAIPRIKNEDVVGVYQFWIFLLLAILAWVAMAVVVSISDAICFELLGDKPHLYGHQRLWGSVGWGLFSVVAGFLVDSYSDDETKKDYTSVFYLMVATMVVGVTFSSRLKYTQQKFSSSILKDVGKLLTNIRVFIYIIWCIFVGACTGLVWQFLFWHIEDVAKHYDGVEGGCGTASWIKTLEGLAMGIQCIGGELPFFFLSGWILNRIGHVHCMSIVLLGIGVRYTLYSFLLNPWWVLPIELMNGITFGLFYATMASYASIVAPPGTEATIQGLVGAVFEGVGVSLGSLIGGILYDTYHGWITFRCFGIASLILCVLHFGIQQILSSNNNSVAVASAQYMKPKDAIRIIDEELQDLSLVE